MSSKSTNPKDYLRVGDIIEQLAEPRASTVDIQNIGKVSSDAMAAKTILWLREQLGEDVSYGEIVDVLDDAKWWLQLFNKVILGDRMVNDSN